MRSRCPKRAAGHVIPALAYTPEGGTFPEDERGGRCYWCNGLPDPAERITMAVAVILRHLPDVEPADLATTSGRIKVAELERIGAWLAAHAHAGADHA